MDTYEITKVLIKLEERIEELERRLNEINASTSNTNTNSSTDTWKVIVSPKGEHPTYKKYIFDTGIAKSTPRSQIQAGINYHDQVYLNANNNSTILMNLSHYRTDETGFQWYNAEHVWEVYIN